MNYTKLPKKKPKLYKCVCCKGCTKTCFSNSKMATKEYALRQSETKICNNATLKTFKEDKLTPEKDKRK